MSGENTSEKSIILSEDLIVYILKRVPVKCVLLCMSVCKSWYTLIKTTHFISTHLTHQIAISNNVSVLGTKDPFDLRNFADTRKFLVYFDNTSFETHLELTFPVEGFVINGASYCKGIVCLGHDSDPIVVLWNPSLRKTLSLNVPHTVVGKTETLILGIDFDSASNDYKVVSVAYVRNQSERKTTCVGVWVYSLNVGAWRRVFADFVLEGDCSIHVRGVPLNGVIHWLVFRSLDGVVGWDVGKSFPVSVLMFDVAAETFSKITLPTGIVDDHYPLFLYATVMTLPERGTKEEYLSYLHVCHGFKLGLWVMEEVHGMVKSWRMALSIDLWSNDHLLNGTKNGEIMVELEGGRFVSLDLRGLKVAVENHQKLEYLGIYVESLVLL